MLVVGLGQYAQAVDVFTRCLASDPTRRAEVQTWLDRTARPK